MDTSNLSSFDPNHCTTNEFKYSLRPVRLKLLDAAFFPRSDHEGKTRPLEVCASSTFLFFFKINEPFLDREIF
jgi:hypothetical protein